MEKEECPFQRVVTFRYGEWTDEATHSSAVNATMRNQMWAADGKKLPDGADRILNKKETALLIGVSVSTLDRMISRNEFPPPRQLSPRRVGWPLSLILAWISARPIRTA